MTNKIQKDVSSLITALNKMRVEFKKIESDYSKEYTSDLLDMIEIITVDAAHSRMDTSKIIDFANHARTYAHYLPVSQTDGYGKGHVPRITKTTNEQETHTGTPQSATPTSIILAKDASDCDGMYTGHVLRIIEGAGRGEQQTIKAYDGKTKIATLHGTWTTIPDTTSVYVIINPEPRELKMLVNLNVNPDIKTEFESLKEIHGMVFSDALEIGMKMAIKSTQSTNNNYGEFNPVDNSGELGNMKLPGSILRFQKPHPSVAIHPTQKPIELVEYLVRTYSNEGDMVHDSCLGSGATLKACMNSNRNCIGFEISDEWEDNYKKLLRTNDTKLDIWM